MASGSDHFELSDGAPFWPSLSTTDIAGEDITTVNPPNVAPGCSPQNLTLPNFRTGGNFFLNPACVSLTPMTATNASYCDQRLAAGTCSNIRGDLGRNTVLGPGLFNADLSLVKNTYIRKISETFDVQFRAEFFNVLNHTNFAPPPSANLTLLNSKGVVNSTYGQLTSTQNPNREIQFGLKLLW